jgi:hypothetical protein
LSFSGASDPQVSCSPSARKPFAFGLGQGFTRRRKRDRDFRHALATKRNAPAHDPEKCERFSEKIMRTSKT